MKPKVLRWFIHFFPCLFGLSFGYLASRPVVPAAPQPPVSGQFVLRHEFPVLANATHGSVLECLCPVLSRYLELPWALHMVMRTPAYIAPYGTPDWSALTEDVSANKPLEASLLWTSDHADLVLSNPTRPKTHVIH